MSNMQIIINHWAETLLKSPAKKMNAPIIEACTGVPHYKAREDQRQKVFAKVTKENYGIMLERIKKLPDDDTVAGSSNFGKFMDYFSNEDDSWVEEINKVLEGYMDDVEATLDEADRYASENEKRFTHEEVFGKK